MILVVDDNYMNRKVIVNLLGKYDLVVEEADSGISCVEMAAQKEYQLILMDHMMPEMDGIEALHIIRDTQGCPCKNVPIVVLTSNTYYGAKQRYISEGFDDFLAKPLQPERLESVLEKYGIIRKECIEKEKLSQMPVIEGIDWEYAYEHFSKEEHLRNSLEDFYESIGREGQELRNIYEDVRHGKDMSTYRIKVHSMKGTSALIGATDLAKKARELEYAAIDNNVGLVIEKTPAFINEWLSYKDKLKMFAKVKDVKEKVEDYNEILAYMNMLIVAADNIDMDEMDRIIVKVNKYEYEEGIKAYVDRLSGAVSDFNVETVKILAAKVTEIIREMR